MRFAIALMGLLAGCASSFAELPPDDPRRLSVPAQHDREWREERGLDSAAEQDDLAEQHELAQLLTRARFDLQCPEATMVVLERHTAGPPTLVGGAGCGRQVTYERRLRRNGWTGRHTTRNTKWDRKG